MKENKYDDKGLSSFLCKFQKNILGRESSPFLYCKTFED